MRRVDDDRQRQGAGVLARERGMHSKAVALGEFGQADLAAQDDLGLGEIAEGLIQERAEIGMAPDLVAEQQEPALQMRPHLVAGDHAEDVGLLRRQPGERGFEISHRRIDAVIGEQQIALATMRPLAKAMRPGAEIEPGILAHDHVEHMGRQGLAGFGDERCGGDDDDAEPAAAQRIEIRPDMIADQTVLIIMGKKAKLRDTALLAPVGGDFVTEKVAQWELNLPNSFKDLLNIGPAGEGQALARL